MKIAKDLKYLLLLCAVAVISFLLFCPFLSRALALRAERAPYKDWSRYFISSMRGVPFKVPEKYVLSDIRYEGVSSRDIRQTQRI